MVSTENHFAPRETGMIEKVGSGQWKHMGDAFPSLTQIWQRKGEKMGGTCNSLVTASEPNFKHKQGPWNEVTEIQGKVAHSF